VSKSLYQQLTTVRSGGACAQGRLWSRRRVDSGTPAALDPDYDGGCWKVGMASRSVRADTGLALLAPQQVHTTGKS
jgi:hypothetical protein